MSFLQKYLIPLQKQYPDKTFQWQYGKDWHFERIVVDGDIPILEMNWFYKNKNTKEIDEDSGYISLNFYPPEPKSQKFVFMGFEIDDPYRVSKPIMSLSLTKTGSEWIISESLPFIFSGDEEVLDKLKNSLCKRNELLKDFRGQ